MISLLASPSRFSTDITLLDLVAAFSRISSSLGFALYVLSTSSTVVLFLFQSDVSPFFFDELVGGFSIRFGVPV